VESKGVLRLGFPTLKTTRGSPPSLRMTSSSKQIEASEALAIPRAGAPGAPKAKAKETADPSLRSDDIFLGANIRRLGHGGTVSSGIKVGTGHV
jgi:hypothetical protein